MKTNVLTFLTVIIGFTACTENNPIENAMNDTPTKQVYNLNRRSYAEALEIAQNSIKILQEEGASTRTNNPRTLNLQTGIKAVCQSNTRTTGGSAANDTLLYIFNFNDEQGFAVVSTVRQTEGLIAVVEKGNYDPAVKTGNPGFDTYMQMAKAYVANAQLEKISEEIITTRATGDILMMKPVYDTTYYRKIEPRISVQWGQEHIMGMYCPNGCSGCVNTATAQIMSYFQYPGSLNLTFDGRDVETTALDWTAMCSYIQTTYPADATTVTAKQIGRLARQLGELAGSTYHDDSKTTSTSIKNIQKTIKSLGYTVGDITDYEYNANNPGGDLNAGYPWANYLWNGKLLQMFGLNSENEGHSWVLDGCLYVKALHRMMYTSDGETWQVYQELGTCYTRQNHFNWGWDGKYNGYFQIDIFNAKKALSYDIEKPNYEDDLNFYDNVQYFTVEL